MIIYSDQLLRYVSLLFLNDNEDFRALLSPIMASQYYLIRIISKAMGFIYTISLCKPARSSILDSDRIHP